MTIFNLVPFSLPLSYFFVQFSGCMKSDFNRLNRDGFLFILYNYILIFLCKQTIYLFFIVIICQIDVYYYKLIFYLVTYGSTYFCKNWTLSKTNGLNVAVTAIIKFLFGLTEYSGLVWASSPEFESHHSGFSEPPY